MADHELLMTKNQATAMITITVINFVLLAVVLGFTGYVFYVVHHAVEALRDVGEQWRQLK